MVAVALRCSAACAAAKDPNPNANRNPNPNPDPDPDLNPNLQAKDVLRVFVEFDSDGNGELDISEFREALRIMGVILPPDRMRKLFKYFDQDDNNMVRPPYHPLATPLPPVASPHHPLVSHSPAPHQPLTTPSPTPHQPLTNPLTAPLGRLPRVL